MELKFTINPAVPKFLIRDVLGKLAYLDERIHAARISGTGDLIELELRKGGEEDRDSLAQRINSLVGAMSEDAFEPDLRVLEQHRPRIPVGIDPLPELLERREIVQEGTGFFVVGPLLTQVIQYFEGRMIEVAEAMGALAFRFPALISPRYLERVKYFKNFPHSLSFVSHLRENLPDIERFMDEASVSDDGSIAASAQGYANPSAMLSPTICHHLYLALSESEIPENGITATASGNCFRYESINMVSLERVWNFTMREIIFVGTDEQVSERIEAVRRAMRPLFEELDLSYNVITANDPFFIGTFRDQAAYQAAFELKFEVRADLPYKSDTVAVGSYNRHGDFFGRTLNIRLPDGSPACTGCFGAGFERLALAFVTQQGTDPQNWPAKIRKFATARSRAYKIKPIAGAHCNWC